jgi:C1A family cysteine protease
MPKFNKYGWRPDKPDKRDRYKLAHVDASSLPESVDLRPLMPPVYNQDNLGMCTGTAIAADCHYQMIRQGGSVWQPSPMFIYYNERVIEGTVNVDCGAELRNGMKAINRWGVCPESLYPFIASDFKKKPSRQAYAEAIKHRVVEYTRIPQSLIQLKACLAEGDPFVFGFTVYDSFESDVVATTGNMPMPSANESMLGGHAVKSVGFDDSRKVFIVRNSWSSGWGDKGYFYMPYEFIVDPDYAADFWTVKLIPA